MKDSGGREWGKCVLVCVWVCVVGLEVLRQQLFRRLNCAKSENLTKSYFICEQGDCMCVCVWVCVTRTATIAVARVKHI